MLISWLSASHIRPSRIATAVLLVITFCVYLPVIGHDFLNWDDPLFIVNNADIRWLSWHNLKRIFSNPVESVYIPLTTLSFALEFHFVKLQPWLYHLDNLLLHMAVVALVFRFAVQTGLSLRAGFLAALLFAVHPMHVESVAWVTERKDTLYAVFYMLALTVYWLYLNSVHKKYLALATFLGICSMLAKPMAISLPLIFFLCDWLKKRKFSTGLLLEKAPLAAVLGILGWITYSYYRRVPGHDLGQALPIVIWTSTFYVRKFFMPFNLDPFYALPQPVTFLSGEYFLAALILAAAIFCLRRYRTDRLLIFAAAYYLCSIFFLLRLDTAADRNIVADRFMYLPCLGICFFIGRAWDRFLTAETKGRNVFLTRISLAAAFFLSLSMTTFGQSGIWKNNAIFWNHLISSDPENPLAYHHRGIMFEDRKDFKAALRDYNKAISLKPDYIEAFNNRGLLYSKVERFDLALKDFDRVLEIKPSDKKGLVNRGYLYFIRKDYALAQKDLTKAVALNPDYAEAFNVRGCVYEAQKKYAEALADYHAAIYLNPYFTEAYNNRGVVYAHEKFFQYALADFNTALDLNPEFAKALINRSYAYYDMKDFGRALKDVQQVQKLGFRVQETYLRSLQKKVHLEKPSAP